NSAQLELNSEDDATAEESAEETSEDKDDAIEDNSAGDVSESDKTDSSTKDSEDAEAVIDGTIISQTNNYAYVVHGDNEYCSVNLCESGEELCTIKQEDCDYPVNFEEGKVEEYENLLGSSSFVITIQSGDYYLLEVYSCKDEDVECIEEDYITDYFVEDIDSDGHDELIVNMIYMAGGRGGVFIFRKNNDSIQSAKVNADYNQVNVFYDSENKEINISYPTDSGEFEEITIPIEDALNDPEMVEFEDI
nr:hypothetical protein [Butyrivibrio sp.]